MFLAQLLLELPNAYQDPSKDFNVSMENSTDPSIDSIQSNNNIQLMVWSYMSWMWHNTYCLGGFLVGLTMFGCFINHHVDQRQKRMGAKMRIACCSLIFRKVGTFHRGIA